MERYKKLAILITVHALLLLALPILIYWLSFPDSVISQNNQDWASFGSYLAGVYTFFASLASLATLIFLLYQYFSQKESQQRLASAQLEIINFQKYQTHYQQFMLLIDILERDERYNISVISKDKLYKLLFADNDFEHCSYSIDLSSKGSDYILNDLRSSAATLKDMFSSTEVSAQQAERIVSLLSKLYDLLHLKLDRPEKVGDIVFQVGNSNRYIILNTDDIREVVSSLWAALNTLYHFSGNTPPENITSHVNTSFTNDSMARYKDSIRNEVQGYVLVTA